MSASKIRIETEPLTPELQEKAKRELRESPEVVETAIAELRTALKGQKNIYFDDDDEILLRYLRPCKFYPDSTMDLMKRIADFKEKNKALLQNLMPAQLEPILLNESLVSVLETRDQDGRRIMLHRTGKAWDPKRVTADQIFQLFYIIHQAALLEPATQVNGVVVIMDFDGLGMSQVMALSPSFSARLLSFIQDAMPLRLKEVHIVNQPFIFNMIWKIFKPLIREKLGSRLHMHGKNLKELHKFIEPKYLPAEYGGSFVQEHQDPKEWYPVFRSLDDYIAANNKYGYVK